MGLSVPDVLIQSDMPRLGHFPFLLVAQNITKDYRGMSSGFLMR